jgi:hypothetical protein
MKRSLLTQSVLMALFTLALLWTLPATADNHGQAADGAKKVYTCGCGTAAGCDRISDQPGTTPCGKPLLEKEVLKEDADKVYVCACADGCNCKLDAADPTKCACGKELRAYPKDPAMGCAHGMPAGGGCDKCESCPKKGSCDGCPQQPADSK